MSVRKLAFNLTWMVTNAIILLAGVLLANHFANRWLMLLSFPACFLASMVIARAFDRGKWAARRRRR